jgi:hypothetical protein
MSRFTIRELLLVTVIAALGIGWWLDHSRLSRAVAFYRDWVPFDTAAFPPKPTTWSELRANSAVQDSP